MVCKFTLLQIGMDWIFNPDTITHIVCYIHLVLFLIYRFNLHFYDYPVLSLSLSYACFSDAPKEILTASFSLSISTKTILLSLNDSNNWIEATMLLFAAATGFIQRQCGRVKCPTTSIQAHCQGQMLHPLYEKIKKNLFISHHYTSTCQKHFFKFNTSQAKHWVIKNGWREYRDFFIFLLSWYEMGGCLRTNVICSSDENVCGCEM